MKDGLTHFQVRLKQRFGIDITRKEMANIAKDLSSSKYQTVSKYARGSTLSYIVNIKGVEVLIAFNHYRRHLVTAMIPVRSRPKKEVMNKDIFDRPLILKDK